MTNEKTIEILKELWRYEKTDKYSESEIREAIKNAIKAVEAVDYDCVDCKWYLEVKKNEMYTKDRQVTDGDLISRSSVITMLQKIENVVEDGDGFQFNEWIEYAKDIPSAEKTAKWIWKEGRMGIDYCNCSKCGGGQWEMEFPYCPNCGSRMKGVE